MRGEQNSDELRELGALPALEALGELVGRGDGHRGTLALDPGGDRLKGAIAGEAERSNIGHRTGVRDGRGHRVIRRLDLQQCNRIGARPGDAADVV
jgi:hypothetical protein